MLRVQAWSTHAGWLSLLLACGSPAAAPTPKATDRADKTEPAAALAPTQVAQAQAAPAAVPAAPVAAVPAIPADINAALAYDPADPLANLEAADALDRLARGQQGEAKPPPGGCAVGDGGRRVWPAPGPAAIVGLGSGFVIAGYAQRGDREQLFAVHLPASGLPEPITAFDITPKHPRERSAPPGLAARDDNDLSVAFTDGAGKLFVRRLRVGRGGGSAAAEIASSVDTRFAPAVAHREERTLVAWTVGQTPMRVQLAVLSSENAVLARHDVTPESMGASAPSFVSGASPPVLVAVDARNGFSPLLRIDIGNDGTPQPATVALPISTVAIPPQLAAASSSIGTYVAYAGLGAAATSAVGLVAIAPVVGTPEALIKGTGYGPLHVAATTAPRAVLFAVDAPAQTQPAAKDAPPKDNHRFGGREIRVSAVGLKGTSAAAVIEGPGHHATHAAIARDGDGHVGVAYTDGATGIYVARLRCDDE